MFSLKRLSLSLFLGLGIFSGFTAHADHFLYTGTYTSVHGTVRRVTVYRDYQTNALYAYYSNHRGSYDANPVYFNTYGAQFKSGSWTFEMMPSGPHCFQMVWSPSNPVNDSDRLCLRYPTRHDSTEAAMEE